MESRRGIPSPSPSLSGRDVLDVLSFGEGIGAAGGVGRGSGLIVLTVLAVLTVLTEMEEVVEEVLSGYSAVLVEGIIPNDTEEVEKLSAALVMLNVWELNPGSKLLSSLTMRK
jgi:hypothetical protein